LKKIFPILLFLISLFFSSCTPRSNYGFYYTIKTGDTLYRISKEYEVNISKLKEVNSITDEKRLKIGDYIFIPGISMPQFDDKRQVDVFSKKTVKKKVAKRKRTDKKVSLQKPTKADRKMFIWPVDGVITSLFGARKGTMHEGIDIGLPIGRKVKAAAKGKVIFSNVHGGYGKVVIILHSRGYVTIYAHNSKLLKKEGASVKQGEIIALSGNTGKSISPHVHFEIRKNSKPVNPLHYLPKNKK